MVKTSGLSRKLASYSALATVVLAAEKSGAQIIYTSLSPNVILTIPHKTASDTGYYLDLNNDGIADFHFTAKKSQVNTTTGIYSNLYYDGVKPLNNNKVYVAAAYAYGKYIGSKAAWANNGTLAGEFVFTSTNTKRAFGSGAFLGITNGYLALKLVNKGKTYYGWARITIKTVDTVKLLAYAYNSVAGDSIKAGNTGCSKTPVTPVITHVSDTLSSSHAKSYQWYSGGTLLVNDTSQFFVPTDTGYYSVRTIDTNGCITQSTVINDTVLFKITTGISPVTLSDEAYIYSYNKTVHIVLYDAKLLGSTIIIYNTSGQQIFTTLLTASPTDIDLKLFAAGIYLVKIDRKHPLVKKISIQ